MDAPTIAFPTDYPVKVVARAGEGLRGEIDAIVDRHAGPLVPERISERRSAQQNFVSITYLIVATGEPQLAALFEDLKRSDAVLMVL